MKRDRNSFFSEYSMNSFNTGIPNNMMMNGMPNQAFSANSNFYAGPAIPNTNMYSDIDARLSKIERQLNRLETRISRLEGDNQTNISIDEYNNNPMYMV